jgi:hypothetical protein
MGPHKASKSPPSVSWLRRKEKVRGLYALPQELLKKLFAAESENHHAFRSFGGCVLSIRKGLTKKGQHSII